MKHEYLIIKEHRLIIELFYGEMDLASYVEFKSRQLKDPEYDPNYNLLTDIRWVGFLFPASEVSLISDYFKSVVDINVELKGCLLSIEPLQTAYSMVYKKHASEGQLQWNVCTTLQEALRWLNCNMEEDRLAQVLAEMKAKLVVA